VDKLREVIRKVPAAWQALLVAVALLGAGATVSGYTGLPEKVKRNTAAIRALEMEHAIDRNLLMRMLCNQNPDETFESCEQKYSGVGPEAYTP
jgi:hypothetical protein